MPSIAHLVLGALVGLSLYYISDGKFTKTHAFLLFLNNYYGPDAGYMVNLGNYTHSLVFWPVFAVFLAFIYHYFTKFSLKIDGVRNIELIELDEYKLTYLNTYLVVAAGGCCHIYLDGMLNWKGVLMIYPSIGGQEAFFPNLNDLFNFGTAGLIDIHPVIIIAIGIAFIFGFIFVYVYFLKKNTLFSGILVVIYIIGFMIYFILVGWVATLIHPDAGAIVYVSLFWGTPLILIVLSTREFSFLKNKREIRKKEKKVYNLKVLKFIYLIVGIITILECIALILLTGSIFQMLVDHDIVNASFSSQFTICLMLVSIILIILGVIEILSWRYLQKVENHSRNLLKSSMALFIVGGLILSIAILGLFLNDAITLTIYGLYGEDIGAYFSYEELYSIAVVAEIILLILGIVNIIGAIGLTLRNKSAWRVIIYLYLMFGWTVFGLVLACYLSENSVKEVFKTKDKN